MPADILARRRTHFVLWRPGATDPPPTLFVGRRDDSLDTFRTLPLTPHATFPELWEVPAADCALTEETVYYYWFRVRDTNAYSQAGPILYCTDPFATAIDRTFPAPVPQDIPARLTGASHFDPASVVLFRNGELVPCDPGGQTMDGSHDAPLDERPPNNSLVIYELPTRWSRIDDTGGIDTCSGTFRDVLALLQVETTAPSFPGMRAVTNRAHLLELGVNALELLPPEDSDDNLNWGYGTANYFAADFDLGRPNSTRSSTASTDLTTLIRACHQQGLRFFLDVVMAFCRNNPYANINYLDFLIKFDSGDPEQGSRDGFGGDLIKFNYPITGYDPITGDSAKVYPSRAYLLAHLAHWMNTYRIDGLRLDSVNNIANDDFVREFRDYGRALWSERGGDPARFLVVGEELSVPIDLVSRGSLDGLWNEKFKQIARSVLLGRNWSEEPSFARSVRKLIDCRRLGFADGAQAVNYLTSHDVGGFGNERLLDYLWNNGVSEAEARIKLAFVCLLTAVGIPMILAGDEFADQQDLPTDERTSQGRGNKQVDPVNFSRLAEDWRLRIFHYVARLVRLRTTSRALAVNDTHFLQEDFTEGKRVLAWQRGIGEEIVVVVANFSDWGTARPDAPGAHYTVANWPTTPPGKRWREITQDRDVPTEWAGREPLYPWEAKVYALVPE